MINVICPILVARWAGGQDLAEVPLVTKGERFGVVAEGKQYGTDVASRVSSVCFFIDVRILVCDVQSLLSVWEAPLMVG